MAKGDAFWTAQRKQAALREAEASGNLADSMDVRIGIVNRIKSGEISLEEGQAELAKIKRNAKKQGLQTRASAYKNG